MLYTVGIRRDAYDETLAWINQERAKKGLIPVHEIPAGMAGQSCGCPLSNALGGTPITINTKMPMAARHVLWIIDSHHKGDQVKPVRA
jgi:hypothetical protein